MSSVTDWIRIRSLLARRTAIAGAVIAAVVAGTMGATPAGATLPIDEQFRVSSTGSDGDASRDAVAASVAYNPQANEYLVVWEADGLATDDEVEVFGQRLSAGGAELGGDFRISNVNIDGNPNRGAFAPSVAYNAHANEYLVVWFADGLLTDDEEEVFGQRLSAGGAELGGDFRISTTGTDGSATRDAANPSVAYNSQANEYLVAWYADGLATDDENEVFGQRLSAGGAELGGDFRISTTGSDGDANRAARKASVAYNPQASEYLVAWGADGLATDNEVEVFGQRLSASGAELGGDFRISTTGSDGDLTPAAQEPSLAYNAPANEYLVAWLATDAQNETEVFGQRLAGGGAELGGDFRISVTGVDGDDARTALEPAVAANPQANEYLVVWRADGLATDNEFEVFARRSGGGPPPSAEPPAQPPAEPPAVGADTIAPLVSGLALSRDRFRVGPQPTPLIARRRRRAQAGTTVSYVLSEDALVSFAIERALPGRLTRIRGRRRCVKPTPTLVRRRARRCERHRPAGVLTRQATSGANRLAFSGRVGTRALPPGKYRLTLQATDAAGNRSRGASRSFTIVRIR